MVRTAPLASLVTSLSQYGSTGQEIRDNLLKNPRAESANKILSAIPAFETSVNDSALSAPQKSIVLAAVEELETTVTDYLRHTNILSGKEVGDPLAEQSQQFIDLITDIAANAANGSEAANAAWAAANAAWANAQAAFANAQSALDYALLATGAANLAGTYAVAANNSAASANSSSSAANGYAFLAAGHASSANAAAFQANLAAVSANSSAASANSSAILSANFAGQANSAAIVAQQFAADANASAANAAASLIITAGHAAAANSSAAAAAANAVAAQGFAVSANSSAANAASQVTLAAGHAAAANSSAAASAANAVSAQSSATSANTSAASANSSAVLASGFATAANSSAAAAAANAVSAQSSATAANSSAASANASSTLSASYVTSAVAATTQSFPTTLVNMGTLAAPTFWTGDADTAVVGMASIGTDSYGPFVRNPVATYGVIGRKGKSPNFVKKKWKVRVLVAHETGTPWTCELRLGYYPDPIPLNAGRITIDFAISQIISSTTPVWIEKEFTAQGHPYVKPEIVLNYPVAQATTVQRIYAIELVDVDANKKVYNLDFENGLTNWGLNDNGTGPDISKPKFDRDSTSYFGRPHVMKMGPNTSASIFYKEMIPIDTSRKYKISTWVAAYADSAGTSTGVTSTFYVGFVGLDAAGNVLDHGSFGSYRYCCLQGGTYGHGNGSGDMSVIVTGEGNDSWVKFPPGTKYIYPMAILNYTSTNIDSFIDYIKVEDVTSELAANASATIATAAAVAANSSAASASTSSVLAATLSRGYLNHNANFAYWPTDTSTPVISGAGGWDVWSGGAVAPGGLNRRLPMSSMGLSGRGPEGSEWVYQGVVPGGADQVGLICNPDLIPVSPGRHTVEATAQLMDVSYVGSGVLVYMFNAGGTYLGAHYLRFWIDPDIDGVVSTGGFGIRKWSSNFTTVAGTTHIRVYAMANWGGFPSGAQSNKAIAFYKVGFKAGDATDATVATHSSAIATLDTKTASYMLKTSAGAGTASLIMVATDSGGNVASSVKLIAGSVELGNGTSSVPTLAISNGVAQFTGELNVGTGSGARVNITKDLIRVYDANNVMRVRIGVW